MSGKNKLQEDYKDLIVCRGQTYVMYPSRNIFLIKFEKNALYHYINYKEQKCNKKTCQTDRISNSHKGPISYSFMYCELLLVKEQL